MRGGVLFRRLIREPLLHFLILGLCLFLLYDVVSVGKWSGSRRIVVDGATVAAIIERFQGAWQRPPTAAELNGLIDAYVNEEIDYREGTALGLDRDDPIVRRRVLQKLTVMTEESSAGAAPTEADLVAYLQAYSARYAHPGLIGFDQAVFDPQRHGTHIQTDMTAALNQLRAGTSPNAFGDSSMLARHLDAVAADLIARDFGEEFAMALQGLQIGMWSGPVLSGYGLHLVRVNK